MAGIFNQSGVIENYWVDFAILVSNALPSPILEGIFKPIGRFPRGED